MAASYLLSNVQELERQWPSMEYPKDKPYQLIRNRVNPPITFQPGSRRFPVPPSQDPLTVFKPMINLCTAPDVRWVRVDPTGGTNHAVLMYVDGAASNNGRPEVRAGCGVMVSPRPENKGVAFPLEKLEGEELTSNRAELRAAYGALGMRFWGGEGFETLVIATDSEYMVKGANEWVAKWKANGWKTASGQPVKNKDLWILLIDKIEKYERDGIAVLFYLIERRFNKADAPAKRATAESDVPTQIREVALMAF